MQSVLIILDSLDQWQPYYETESVITATDYLQSNILNNQPHLIINLCNDMKYHGEGYYCSLLAQARGHKAIPDVEVLNRLESGAVMRLEDSLQKLCYRWMESKQAHEQEIFQFDIFFGTCKDPELEKVARYIFEQHPSPMLRVTLAFRKKNQVEFIRPLTLAELDDQQQDMFAVALDNFSKKVWRQPRLPKPARFDLAILYDPEEQLPPSNKGALNRFLSQAKKMNINAELITGHDSTRLLEFDALFIRQTTTLNHITYRMSQAAQQADMVVIDDPLSIIRCTNKVYLKELLDREEIPTPPSRLLFRGTPMSFREITSQLGEPIVLKVPDGSFSFGMMKIKDEPEYYNGVASLFKHSAIILAQKFMPTDFDWRIGLLNGEPLFACKYFMARGHWQIYNHLESGKTTAGTFETVPISKVPKHVLKNAMKAAGLIGKGLYGVDLKAFDDTSVVIEVNDNPSIDHGVEDAILGDELYRLILREITDRLDNNHR